MDEEQAHKEIETLRERVKDYLAKHSVSLAAIARRAGIGSSTLSAWMNGTYEGRVGQVSDKVRVWLDAQEAMATSASSVPAPIAWTRTPTSQAIIDVFEYAQATGDIGVVVGNAGIGKTISAKHYTSIRPNVWLFTADPSLRGGHAILHYIGEVLGVQETRSERLSRAICQRLVDTMGLLIVDEAQHMRTDGLEQLRSLHDRAGVGLVIMGNQGLWTRMDGGGRKNDFAQLFSRVGMRLTKGRPTAGDINAILDAAGIEGDAPRRMLKAIATKPGALRGMIKTLRLARMMSADHAEDLTEEAIERAFQRLAGVGEMAA